MLRDRMKVEEKELDFEFEVVNVQFNRVGRYVLMLTVENPLLEDSGEGVQLRVSDGNVLQTNSGCTDTIEQTGPNELCTCINNRFVFTLPKGFCKNDQDHDVRLRVEALRVRESDRGHGTKAGEGFFAIYPRTNTPRINLFVGQDEELYQYSGIMALLRVHKDYLSMHCGRLVYTVSFHEARPFCRNTRYSTRMSPLLGSVHKATAEGEASPGPTTLQVPPLMGLGSDVSTPRNTKTSALSSTQPPPQTHLEQLPAVDIEMERSGVSLPSSPESNVCSTPDQYTQTTATGNHFPLEFALTEAPEPFPYNKVIEDAREGEALLDDFHVSSPGTESAVITLHGAVNLPHLSDGELPQPFAIVKSGVDDSLSGRSVGVTRCTQQPTHCPLWRETLSVQLQGEVVVLNVADSKSKELLAHYRLPVGCLRPFQHHHLELVQSHHSVPSGVRLYVTVVRKVSILPRQPHFSFTGFEVLLKAMEKPLKDPVGSLLTVARIVPNYHSYRDATLLCSPSTAGITMTPIFFPNPPESAFHPPHLSAQGRPQVSKVGSPEDQPVWNHCFLFLERDCATMFSGTAALVLEYYPSSTDMDSAGWHIRSSLGFSALPLNQELYRMLMSERGRSGVKVEKLPLRGSSLQTTSDTNPAVSVALRLICSEHPDPSLATVDTSQLPSLDPERLEGREDTPPATDPLPSLQTGEGEGEEEEEEEEEEEAPIAPPSSNHHTQKHLSLQTDGYNLPSYDALAKILPDYQYLFQTNKSESHHTAQQGQDSNKPRDPSNINQTYQVPPLQKRPALPDFENGARMQEITALQTQEVENYRSAMSKMAEDIITLRTQVASLETENSQLRSDLSLHQDLGRDLLDDTDVDVMTKAEITDRIADLKFKLASETTKAASHKDKIQQLQNELIRKNDSEKELLMLQKVYKQQQGDLQRFQACVTKLASLEITVKQQEKVIEKMEKALDNRLREKYKQNVVKNQVAKKGEVDSRKEEMESALAAENARLRGELERMREQPHLPIIIQPLTQAQEMIPDKERLRLLSKLEKAEAKINTLETQLEDNSKVWGRQKQEMLTKLNEYRHGFA